jgi:ribose 5-phosphate isomerase A
MPLDKNKQAEIKRHLGKQAASYVEAGMLVGLGTGSTSECFIHSLAERCNSGLKIKGAVSSSVRSHDLAKSLGIPTLDINEVTHIDLTADGADEIDPQYRMIKGGGGALVREKIVASSSKKMIILIDESKLVSQLGKFGLPIEILPFGIKATLYKLEQLGFTGKMRMKEGCLYVTDNGNHIFDLSSQLFSNPEKTDQLVRIPGVVDTGFFFHLATNLLVGYADGRVEEKKC